ncbi:Putative eukaryotic translation initiation factor 4E [Podospora comata]|uniref:Eukaryotic translation initiation factor 4E n=1 Tax=Podospora comata TaxID=48703 RepID=A0ABY6S1P9_PODCO|nr:Putative eukaryotic translation initiation factor 4E [Podospora comata]
MSQPPNPRPGLGLFTRGLSSLSQSTTDPNSPSVTTPAEQRDDAKRNFLKAMRPLPTQHYWNVWFDRPPTSTNPGEEYHSNLEQLGTTIESVQDFWRYANNTPVDQIRMKESIYLFKVGFKPIWEDRRNILGGSWTFRVPKGNGPDVWTRVQLLAVGEKLQSVLEEGDQICGVGLSVRFNSHLISIWHRDSSKKKSIDAMLECVLEELPPELTPKPDNYFYKKHSDHAGFKVPPELQAVIDSQKAREKAATEKAAQGVQAVAGEAPEIREVPPSS